MEKKLTDTFIDDGQGNALVDIFIDDGQGNALASTFIDGGQRSVVDFISFILSATK